MTEPYDKIGEYIEGLYAPVSEELERLRRTGEEGRPEIEVQGYLSELINPTLGQRLKCRGGLLVERRELAANLLQLRRISSVPNRVALPSLATKSPIRW